MENTGFEFYQLLSYFNQNDEQKTDRRTSDYRSPP